MATLVDDHGDLRSSAERWFASLVAGAICGVLVVVLSIGVGTLLFSASLRSLVPVSIGMALAGSAVLTLVIALTSSIRGAVSPVQEVPVIALATVVAAVVAALPTDTPTPATLATVITAIAIASMVSGVIALLLGTYRLGRIIHFVPYPVVGGFLAGTGWLIAVGGLSLVLGEAPGRGSLDRLTDMPVALNLGLALLLVVVLTVIEARSSNALMLPAAIFVALAAFNSGAAFLSFDSDTLHGLGWLVDIPAGGMWPPIGAGDLGLVDWAAVAHGMIAVPPMIVITVMSLLMNVTGIEMESRADLDLDRELRSIGAANLFAGAAGGMAGFPAVSLTLLASRLGAGTRLVGVIAAIILLASLGFGHIVIDFIPTFLLGAILMWVGGILLFQWLVLSYRRLDKWEYLIIVLIFAVIVGVDFAIGILLGLIATVVLFVVQYGRVDAVRLSITGRDFHSSAAGSEERRRLLATLGHSILIVRLQGFLFFGTADHLRRALADRVDAGGETPVRYLLVDFGRVTGIDSSAVSRMISLTRIAGRDGIAIVLSGVSPRVGAALGRGGLDMEGNRNPRIEADFEAALKWCEDSLLAESRPEFSDSRPRPVSELLAEILEDEVMAARLAPYLDRVTVRPGILLIEDGAPSDDVFLVEAGWAAVMMRSDLDSVVRVATIGPGSIIGELSYYLRAPRSASIISDDDMVVWRFSRAALDRLKSEAPDVAFRFHEGMARMLSERLQGTNRIVRFLAD